MADVNSDTRTKILDVAQDLVQRHGLNAMSFQDLSDAVGIRKASVHYHFPSKAEMVNALVERYLQDFDHVVQGILRSRASGKSKLKRYCGLFLGTLQSDEQKGCLCGMLMAEMLSIDAEALEHVRRFMTQNVHYITDMIETGVEDGTLIEPNDIAKRSQAILATLEGGLMMARCEGGPKRFAGIVDCVVEDLSQN